MSKPISAALFDLGGVLFRFDPVARLRRLCRRTGVPPEELQRRLWDSGFSHACDQGRFTAAGMHAEACRRLGCRLSYGEFRALWSSAFEPQREVLEIAHRLCRQMRTGILTDNPELLHEELLASFPEVLSPFDPVLFSYCLGACKPARSVYEEALRELGRPPAQVLFVDDAAANVAAAELAGMRALLFTTAADLREELAARGLPV